MSKTLKNALIQSIELAEGVREVHDNIKFILGDDYQQAIAPYVDLIKDRMNRTGLSAFKAVLFFIEMDSSDYKGISLFISAAVEIMEEEKN